MYQHVPAKYTENKKAMHCTTLKSSVRAICVVVGTKNVYNSYISCIATISSDPRSFLSLLPSEKSSKIVFEEGQKSMEH